MNLVPAVQIVVAPKTNLISVAILSDGKSCRLLESYASADALLAHLKGPIVQQILPKLIEHVVIDRCEVFGDPGAQAAAMLSQFGAQFFPRWGGLDR